MSRAEVKAPQVKIFQKIPEACRTTGLSQYYLRKGCKEGTIPYTRTTPDGPYYINVPALLKQLGVPLQGLDSSGLG